MKKELSGCHFAHDDAVIATKDHSKWVSSSLEGVRLVSSGEFIFGVGMACGGGTQCDVFSRGPRSPAAPLLPHQVSSSQSDISLISLIFLRYIEYEHKCTNQSFSL